MARRDPHSYNDDAQVETAHLALTARVDFADRVLAAEAVLTFAAPGSGALDLDTRDLAIEAVADLEGRPLAHVLHPAEPVLGARLSIELPAGARGVRIRYRTSPGASALQWLEPVQTSGGRHPFLFSQCQAIHARSVVPLQDTPRVRIRYTAALTVPRSLRAVMAAAPVGRTEHGDTAVERYEMPQPIAPYLLAFAVGDLASRDLSPRARVWAEPEVVDRAAHEFAAVEDMMTAAEALFGPYDWDRYDVLAMPPSFPYGGMENPRLTFVTPTVIAGDRSLVDVIAHELAHSWTGNLVTNANAEHFWLNEGFTVYAERRILEALYGREHAELSAALGRRALDEAVAGFAEKPELTRLRTHLAGVDPDESFSRVPYEKGYLFLRALEEAVGREVFDGWLRRYLQAFRFRAITTDDFTAHLEQELPGLLARVDAPRWIEGAGVPEAAPRARSVRMEAIERLGSALPDESAGRAWAPQEWQLYLESVPRPAPVELCRALDERFALTESTNYEVLVAWLVLGLSSGYHRVVPRTEEVLGAVGRMKYLRPLYRALATDARTRPIAARTFDRFAAGYHPIARQVVEAELRRAAG